MTSKKITSTIGSVADSIESTWNRLVMGVKARHMPKSIKKVKKTLQGNRQGFNPDWDYVERDTDIVDKVSFYPKYMGSTLIEELIDPEPGANYYNTGLSTKALDRIVKMTRNNSLVDVSLNISARTVQIIGLSSKTIIVEVGMERISFCCHDRKYSKVVSFISRNSINDTMECHAFLCDRQKMAKAIAGALAQTHRKSKERKMSLHAENGEEQGSGIRKDEVKNDILMTDTRVTEPDSNLNTLHNLESVQMRKDLSKTYSDHTENTDNHHSLLELEDPIQTSFTTSTTTTTNIPVPMNTTSIASSTSYDLDFLQIGVCNNNPFAPQKVEVSHQPSDASYASNRHSEPLVIDDDLLPPVSRGRADSDSWAVMASGTGHDSNNVDLELEFSNFARSRSQTNLNELHTSVHSAWDI